VRKPSITFQLTLLFAAASTLILLAVGAVLAILVNEHFEMEDVTELEEKARAIDLTLPAPATAVVNATPGIEIPAAMAQEIPRTADGLGTSLPLVWESGGRTYRAIAYRVARPVTGTPLTIVAALDMSHHRAFMTVFQRALWASVIVGIVFSIPMGWIAARRGTASLRHFTRLAAHISAPSLGERVTVDRIPVELSALACTFNEMLARLEDSFRRLSDFSSDLAHELRTPITNVMTQTQVVLAQARDADEYREALYSNLEEFQRLSRVVDEMLFLARSEHGLELPERTAVDLAAETDGLLEFFEPLACAKGLQLVRTGEATAFGDRLMIRRAIANLVSNAIRHTEQGQVVSVALASGVDGSARVSVENPGPDIPPEHLSRIFDRFYRADPSRSIGDGGSGLGLAITRAIVTAHRGAIEVSSKLGRTAFTISLPPPFITAS
jgi:two-component system heavy metal sensor histidine kinase CusS